ncbi:MAG: RHS repeat-associated core domain-containing protein [Gemmatimonadales bacterium]
MVWQKADLYVDSLQYDASGNLTRKYSERPGPRILTFTMLAKSNRLQKDHNPADSYSVNHYYDRNGADTLNKPTVSSATTAPLYRWMYYDGLGRIAGYRQGKWTSFPGNLSFDVTGTACRYDADGQMYMPCNTSAPPLSFDGANVIGTVNGWRYIHAPGVDEPLLARREDVTGYWQRELYFVTDGQGRQLSVGDQGGAFNSQDADAGYIHGGWRFGGAARNATGFGATRFDSPALPGVSLFRNRAYDSRTGRWTQEDPIGVAGGLNLYQFNGNDPVAYTDPFGLCKPWPDCMFQAAANWGATKGGALGGVVLNAAAAANGLSEALGTNELGRAVGDGDIGGMLVAGAGFLPVGRIAGKGDDAFRVIMQHVGSDAKAITNEAGDLILQSADEMREIRFDFNNHAPHRSPHVHVIEYKNVKNRKVETRNDRVFPRDVSPE